MYIKVLRSIGILLELNYFINSFQFNQSIFYIVDVNYFIIYIFEQ